MPATAPDILAAAQAALTARGQQRDRPGGERSMPLAVAIFNAAGGGASGPGGCMTESDGWRFMVCLKLARARQGGHTLDDYTDLAGYAALLGECEEREAARRLAAEQQEAAP